MRGTIGYKYHIQCIVPRSSQVTGWSHVPRGYSVSVVVGPGFKFTSFERVIKITASYARDSDGRILEFGVYRPLGLRLWFTNIMSMSKSGGKLWLFTILS